MKIQLYQTVKPTYIFQGLTAEIVWLPEAVRFFNVRIDMMVEDCASPYPRLPALRRAGPRQESN